jgi:hypothetical protein
MNDKKTVGKIYTEIQNKPSDKANVFEFTSAIGNDLMPKLIALVERDRKNTTNDFFVEVCFRMNALMPGVPEFYLISRHTCPTPFPDRAAFHYDMKKQDLFFLWHVPSLQECDYYINNMLTLREDEKEALHNVLDYRNGTLLRLAKKLNGEVNDYELTFFRKDSNGEEGKIIS